MEGMDKMWIRTKDNEVLEINSVIYKNGQPYNFTWKDKNGKIKRFSLDEIDKYGEKIEDTCKSFQGVSKIWGCLPTIYSSGYCRDYDKFDRELDGEVVDAIYGGYFNEISDFEAEFIAYCKYNRAKRCFEQIEPRKV